jgi:hypothetical protein
MCLRTLGVAAFLAAASLTFPSLSQAGGLHVSIGLGIPFPVLVAPPLPVIIAPHPVVVYRPPVVIEQPHVVYARPQPYYRDHPGRWEHRRRHHRHYRHYDD